LHVLALASAPKKENHPFPATLGPRPFARCCRRRVSPMRFAPRGLASNRSPQPRGCDSSPPLRASADGTPACDSTNHAPGSALSGEARRRRHTSGAGCSAWALQHPPPTPPAPSPWGEEGRGSTAAAPACSIPTFIQQDDKRGVILLCYATKESLSTTYHSPASAFISGIYPLHITCFASKRSWP
jgi:hypothetical protein